MKPTHMSALLSVLVVALAGLARAASPAPPGDVPADVTKGGTLSGVVTSRQMPNVLAVDSVGSNTKLTWLDFDHVIANRSER